jgi:DNA repair protein RadC
MTSRNLSLEDSDEQISQFAVKLPAIIAHNHPSGESNPSEADIKITRDLIRAGQLLKIEVLDHIVIGNPNHSSLRSLGYFL